MLRALSCAAVVFVAMICPNPEPSFESTSPPVHFLRDMGDGLFSHPLEGRYVTSRLARPSFGHFHTPNLGSPIDGAFALVDLGANYKCSPQSRSIGSAGQIKSGTLL